jgi:hypothetical protein
MRGRRALIPIGFAVLTSLLLVTLAAADVIVVMGYAAPVLGLLLPLVCGRYVGERHIRRWARLLRHRRRGPVTLPTPAIRPAHARVARGGCLIAASLAERGPPPRAQVA